MLSELMFRVAAPNTELAHTFCLVLIAFLLSTLVGLTYVKTFRGLSYSHNYVQALILGAIVSAMVMLAIGDSLARGLGMIGAMAMIRFRTSFRDARDILFMFASLAAGIGCGVGAYKVAVIGTLAFVGVALILHVSPLGRTRAFDGMLRFSCENSPRNQRVLEDLLKTYCKTFVLITLRDMQQGERLDYAYQIRLKKPGGAELITALSTGIPSARGIGLMLQEATIEL